MSEQTGATASQAVPPAMMRGVLQVASQQVRLVDLPRPSPEPGAAIVRVRASGICGSDLHGYRHREHPETRPSGHEVAGEVVSLPPEYGSRGSPRLREGDRVTLDTICLGRACGSCDWCRQGAYFHCQRKRQGADWTGAFAEYIKRDVRGLFPLPDGLSFAQGAMVEPLAVAVHAVRQMGVRPGESVAVIGAGTIGLTCLIAAVGMGAGPVYVLARHPHQQALVRDLGGVPLAGSAAEAAGAVRAGSGRRGADLVIETVGGAATTLNQALSLARRRGRIAVLGVFGPPVPVDLGKALGLEVEVRFPVCYGEQDGRHDYDVAIELIASGQAPVDRLLTHQFPLDDAARAFSTAADKATGAVKVQFAL